MSNGLPLSRLRGLHWTPITHSPQKHKTIPTSGWSPTSVAGVSEVPALRSTDDAHGHGHTARKLRTTPSSSSGDVTLFCSPSPDDLSSGQSWNDLP